MRTQRTIRRGMSSLQAVMLLGAGFLVTWGLMAAWQSASETAKANTELTVRGQFLRPASTPASDAGRPALPDPPATPGADQPLAEQSVGSLIYDLYAQSLTPAGLDELEKRIGHNPLLWFGSPLLDAEIAVQRIRRIKDTKQKLLATAVGATSFAIDLWPANPAKGEAGAVLHAGEQVAKKEAKQLAGAMSRAEFEAIDLLRDQGAVRKELTRLMEENPGKVLHTRGKNGGDIFAIDLGDGTFGAIRLDPASLKPNPKARFPADGVPHAHKEIVPGPAIRGNGGTGYYANGEAIEKLTNEGTSLTPGAAKGKPGEVHIPAPIRGKFRYDPATGTFVEIP